MAKVAIIVFDSLRKDVFDGCSHPLLEEWRRNGLCFERCSCQSGFTPISFASILSGQFPSQNGVRCTSSTQFKVGEQPRDTGPVWWNVDEHNHGNLLISGSQPLCRSAFSQFETRLLTLRYSKSNVFPELDENEMIRSPEYGQDLGPFYHHCERVSRSSDFLMVIRVYDTHLPYGRGVSICDAESAEAIKRKVADLYARDNGYTLLHKVAVPALQRALDYLAESWNMLKDKLDFLAAMSDHGDNWSNAADYIGHGRFLTPQVLQVPLIIIDGKHFGRNYFYCNNSQVIPTLARLTGKTLDWISRPVPLPLECNSPPVMFRTEANSMDGRYLKASIQPGG